MEDRPAVRFEDRFPDTGVYYVRKLGKRSDWDFQEPSMIAFGDEKKISLYRIASDIELRQVAIGLNTRRPSLSIELFLLPIKQDELVGAGLQVENSQGELECDCANALHVDIDNEGSKINTLIENLVASQRSVVRLTKGDMNSIVGEMSGCKFISQVDCGHQAS